MGQPFEGDSSRDAFGRSKELVVGLSSSHQVVHSNIIAMGEPGSYASTSTAQEEHRNSVARAQSTVAAAFAGIPSAAVAVAVAVATAEEPFHSWVSSTATWGASATNMAAA